MNLDVHPAYTFSHDIALKNNRPLGIITSGIVLIRLNEADSERRDLEAGGLTEVGAGRAAREP